MSPLFRQVADLHRRAVPQIYAIECYLLGLVPGQLLHPREHRCEQRILWMLALPFATPGRRTSPIKRIPSVSFQNLNSSRENNGSAPDSAPGNEFQKLSMMWTEHPSMCSSNCSTVWLPAYN